MNYTTRRYPRTMQEAFGPYTSDALHSKRAPVPPGEQAAGAVLAVIMGIVGAALLLRWSLQ